MFIEQCVHYYSEYQKKLMEIEIEEKNKVINLKDDKIDTLIKKIDNQTELINKQGNMISTQNGMINNQSSKIDLLIDYGENSKNKLNRVYRKLDRANTLLETMNEGLTDFNIRAENMQYFVVYRSHENALKLLFNFGGLPHIRKIKLERNRNGDILEIDETHTPGGLSLRKRCINHFIEINNNLRSELIDELIENDITDDEYDEQIRIYDQNKAIMFNSTSFIINQRYVNRVPIRTILDIIIRTHNARFNRRAELDAQDDGEVIEEN